MAKEYCSIGEVSEYLGIKKSTVYAKVEGKEIRHYRVGRRILFKPTEVEEWMQARKVETVDTGKKARELLRSARAVRPRMDIDRIVKKAVEEVQGSRYNQGHGKSDRIRGLGKEVEHGTL